ncbi:MAG TPA: hypothetical protein VK638_21040, partial [Edaphobacter sp.]|nr:hypothetical protein [Edaphobacter sp.]
DLIKADDAFQLWSQTYDREIKDIFAVEDEIARAATDALQLKLLGGNGQPVALNLRSANPEAYQAYLQAEYFLGRGQSKEDLSKALAYIAKLCSLMLLLTRRSSSMRNMDQPGPCVRRCRI